MPMPTPTPTPTMATFFFSYTPKTVGVGVGDHPSHFMIILFLLVGRSPTKKPMKIGKKIKIEKIFGYLVGRSVGGQFGPLFFFILFLLVGWSPMERKRRREKTKKEIEKYLVSR